MFYILRFKYNEIILLPLLNEIQIMVNFYLNILIKKKEIIKIKKINNKLVFALIIKI